MPHHGRVFSSPALQLLTVSLYAVFIPSVHGFLFSSSYLVGQGNKLCCYIIKHCDARFTTALKSLNDTLLTCKFYENSFTSLKVSVMIKSFGG